MKAFFIAKVLLTASVVALASELAKKSSFFAGITLALPLTSLLALIWLNFESGDQQKIVALSWDIFWLVPPSLAFFPIFAVLVSRNVPFWLSFFIASALTGVTYILYSRFLGLLGIKI